MTSGWKIGAFVVAGIVEEVDPGRPGGVHHLQALVAIDALEGAPGTE